MSIFEGKSPAERNKIIAAIVLGVLAVISLTYTFGGSFFGSKTKVTVEAEASPTATVSTGDTAQNTQTQITDPDENAIYQDYAVTEIRYPGTFDPGPIGGRNIFAFYEPPPPAPPTPFSPTPTKTPTPYQPPTPIEYAINLNFISPQSVYAGSKAFRLEVSGDKFTPESKIVFNGTPLQTTFVNEQRLYADVSAGLIRNASSFTVYVDTFDGKNFSRQIAFNVQAPPKPQLEYIGMIARKHYNNDTAYFQKSSNEDPVGKRLGDEIEGRFRLISISEKEVEVEDKYLGFRHKIAMKQSDPSSSSSRETFTRPGSRTITTPSRNNPVNNTDCVPGIPCDLPRATPRTPTNNPTTKDDSKRP